MVPFSGSEAVEVAIVVPVEMSSANELDAKVVDRVGVSFTLFTVNAMFLLVSFVPSETVKVRL